MSTPHPYIQPIPQKLRRSMPKHHRIRTTVIIDIDDSPVCWINGKRYSLSFAAEALRSIVEGEHHVG